MSTELHPAAPSAPIAAQAARFAMSGGFVALVYLGVTSMLAEVAGAPFQVALAIGFALAISTHFCLQRLFVWTHEGSFALSLRGQALRYLLLAGIQYGLTAAITAAVPHAIGVPTEPVYLITAALLSAANFLLFRSRVFHSGAQESRG